MSATTSSEPTPAAVEEWAGELEALQARMAPRCEGAELERAELEGAEPRRRALASRKGLLSHTERKHGWQLAEEGGERPPDGMQRLVKASRWEADAGRDDLVADGRAHLAAPTWPTPAPSWSAMRRGASRRGPNRPASSANRAGPPASARIARSACSWPLAVGCPLRAQCWWTGRGLCPRSGPALGSDDRPRACPGRGRFPPHPGPARAAS